MDDPRLAPYRNLRNRDTDCESQQFIAEGQLIVDRLIASDCLTESLLVVPGKVDHYAARVTAETPVFCLSRERIRELVGFDFHRGVIGCGRRSPYRDLSELKFPTQATPVALAALGVSDQENLGSMLRSAAALGINQILLGPRTIDPFLRRVIRVSMSSVFQHRFFRCSDPINQLQQLAELAHVRTIASTLQDSTPIGQFVRDDRPMILMVGNEGQGIDAEIQSVATDRVRIPMQLGTNSLNVAVAAAILMYELTRPSEKT